MKSRRHTRFFRIFFYRRHSHVLVVSRHHHWSRITRHIFLLKLFACCRGRGRVSSIYFHSFLHRGMNRMNNHTTMWHSALTWAHGILWAKKAAASECHCSCRSLCQIALISAYYYWYVLWNILNRNRNDCQYFKSAQQRPTTCRAIDPI